MNLNNIDIDALIRKVQKEVRQAKKSSSSNDGQEVVTSSEIFDEMKKLPFAE